MDPNNQAIMDPNNQCSSECLNILNLKRATVIIDGLSKCLIACRTDLETKTLENSQLVRDLRYCGMNLTLYRRKYRNLRNELAKNEIKSILIQTQSMIRNVEATKPSSSAETSTPFAYDLTVLPDEPHESLEHILEI